jgi:ABC-type molybdate transport system substrate-binding protein
VLGAAVSTGGGLREVADAFTKKTGIKVTLVTGNMGTILADAKTATPAADVVMLPMDLMATFALDQGIKPGSFTPLGRLEIGLFKKPDAPFPDITTIEKLAAVLKAATVVTYTDPASGSMQATISANLLKRPEFAGVKGATGGRKPTAASPDGTLSLGVILGEPNPPLGQPSPSDPSLIGRLPPELGAHMDMAAAISARTGDLKNAQAFLAFLTSPEAVPLWAAKGTTVY